MTIFQPGLSKKPKKHKDGAAPIRIQNARDLRAAFAEIQHSPDGADPQPLTIPKCVECAHCGWPVYPRDARPATKKTYERAGIARSYDKKQVKKDKAKGGEGGEDDELNIDSEEEDSEDETNSVDTFELLENKVSELQDEVAELGFTNKALEKERTDLSEELTRTRLDLLDTQDKILMYEESEIRWREKNSNLRIENGELRHFIDRQGSRIGDLESDMVQKLLAISAHKEKYAWLERRQQLMLRKVFDRVVRLEGEENVTICLRFWQAGTIKVRHQREVEAMEERFGQQALQLKIQLAEEQDRVASLEGTCERLRGNLKAAGQRLLMRAMGATKPWATGHALRIWSAAHHGLASENAFERTRDTLQDTERRLRLEEQRAAQLDEDLQKSTAQENKLQKRVDSLSTEISRLLARVDAVGGRAAMAASEISRQAEERAQSQKAELEQKVKAACAKDTAKLQALWDQERVELSDKVAELEAQLLSNTRTATGKAIGEETTDEKERVVPKGQGVLCCGCLTQLVHRGVKQLPPVPNKSPEPLEASEHKRRVFFQKELLGMPDPDDALHSEAWRSRKDPHSGLRYSDIHPPWPMLRPLSASRLTTSRMKEERVFVPNSFR